MKVRTVLAVASTMLLLLALPGSAQPRSDTPSRRARLREAPSIADGFVPAAMRLAQQEHGRYFVVMRAPSVADSVRAAAARGASAASADQRATFAAAQRSQEAAVAQAQSLGGRIVFRYGRLVNGFSAELSGAAAAALASRPDVASVQPVAIVQRLSNDSTEFIGAPEVWDMGFRGEGMRVALVDTGIDYTHADFGGPGTPEAYASNDPADIEPGTFPTAKVIGGMDFVGQDYDVLDDDPTNDLPLPDPDPLDADGHGSHTAGTCCGFGVDGVIQHGVAPKAFLYAVKVWDEGNSTDDVLVAGYEFAVDPDGDGDTSDRADVLSFSGGVDYGTMNSVEAVAAQGVVDLGTVFVAAAGNDGNQPAGGSAYVTGTPGNAPGVISVAASVDAFFGSTLDVNEPDDLDLPDDGTLAVQDWGAPIDSPITTDLFDAREVDPPADPANPQPSDALMCEELPGTPLAGEFALVFKGATGEGDCSGSTKVYNAQLAGAVGVVLWSGFGGLPIPLATNGEPVTIPAVMASTPDSELLGATLSPDAASGTFNTGTVNVTVNPVQPLPEFVDSMTDFSSEGPARVTNALKPDITAPGADITSAGVGTGNGPAVLGGTSMATPHVAGTAALLRQIHPTWSVDRIKAALMNNATLDLSNNDLSTPVPATVMGAGRVRADVSARAVSLAIPPSLSFGLRPLTAPERSVQTVNVTNTDSRHHSYSATGSVRYNDFNPSVASVDVSLDGVTWSNEVSFTVAPGASRAVRVRLTFDPDAVNEADQEDGWYYFHPGVDGELFVRQSSNGPASVLHVPWHAVVMASAHTSLSTSHLDLSDGPGSFSVSGTGAGTPHADLYLLGGTGDVTTRGEEDIVSIGARAFTGSHVDGAGKGLPTGTDAFGGVTWTQFLSAGVEPSEPVEFAAEFAAPHDTTETLEVDVLVDVGADGVFADEGLQADYLIAKPAAPGGTVCVFDLSRPIADGCSATYFADYSNYNSRHVGLVVDAADLGLSDSMSEVAYQVKACTGLFSGDVPALRCDTVGGFDGTTYTARLDTTHPRLMITPQVCGGFWGELSCGPGSPVQVRASTHHQPAAILAIFPNDQPTDKRVTVVRVDT